MYFGRNNDVIPVPAKVFDRSTHCALGFATRIALGSVEEVDTSIEGGFEARECSLITNVPSVLNEINPVIVEV